jgi:hypothetical protein
MVSGTRTLKSIQLCAIMCYCSGKQTFAATNGLHLSENALQMTTEVENPSKVITWARSPKGAELRSGDVRQIQRRKIGFGTNRAFCALSNAPGEHRGGCIGSCDHIHHL